VVGMALSESSAPSRRSASWCEECGYHLRGLPSGQPCPECGHVPPDAAATSSPHKTWSRCVFAGLVLLLLITIHGIVSVLIQSFPQDLGGSATALNMPGPKLWAVPLLQRPIGYSPQMPGVVATRTSLIGLLAVWLITMRNGVGRSSRDETMRLLTRWVSVVSFGLLFGALLSQQGFNRADTFLALRALLVGAVELPGTALLYAYMRRLSNQVPGIERRLAFDRLAVLVPVTIGIGAGILGVQFFLEHTAQYVPNAKHSVIIGAIYGTPCAMCGVAATAAVASLAGAYFQLAFPRAGQFIAAGRFLSRSSVAAGRAIPAPLARRLAVAAGAILFVVLMVLGNDLVLWMFARQGLGANLPFMNYPGPKVWAGVTLGTASRYYMWDPFVTRTSFLFLHLVALWLITVPLREGDTSCLRRWVRWLPTVCLGAGTGAILAFENLYPLNESRGSLRSEIFALMTITLELPATLLLYAMLARVADEAGSERLGRTFRRIAWAIPLFVGTSFALFALSRWLRPLSDTPVVMIVCAVFGGAAFTVAAWATGALLRLAGALIVGSQKESRLASEAANYAELQVVN
jgi:uncharacterized membrane protein